MLLSIFSGLFAAFSQSLSYLASRHYTQGHRAASGLAVGRQLLIISHILMGIFALLALPLCWPWGQTMPWQSFLFPLSMNILLYISAQLGLVTALKHAEASRVSPLLTSKLILSSILSLIFGQPVGDTSRTFTLLQWIGIPLCLIAGIAINYTGGKMKPLAVFAIAWTAANFSVSDYFINLTIKSFTDVHIDNFHAALLTQMLGYIATGIVALPLVGLASSPRPRDWRDALPFSFAWFLGMIGLFYAFATGGLMLGSILQCTRGFMTILLATAFMRRGHHHIEPPAPRKIVLQRLAAGVLMFIGISLYVIERPGQHCETARALTPTTASDLAAYIRAAAALHCVETVATHKEPSHGQAQG